MSDKEQELQELIEVSCKENCLLRAFKSLLERFNEDEKEQ